MATAPEGSPGKDLQAAIARASEANSTSYFPLSSILAMVANCMFDVPS